PTHKYITYYGLWDADELYDLAADPQESKNLLYDPAHAKLARTLENDLYRLMGDLGGMEIPLNPPRGGEKNKRFRARGGDAAADFPEPFVVDEPLNHDAD
ncbi:MAG: sulfatase/phosphatase domain-containing protein, partial [Planctomycetia bacterium]